MSKQAVAAFDSIRKMHGIKATWTATGMQINARDIDSVLGAANVVYVTIKKTREVRIISTTKVDGQIYKDQTLAGKSRSVKKERSTE
jgi:rRNA processing protein Gar1